MSIVKEDLLAYATTNLPNNDAGTLGGAINTANQITDWQMGKLITSPIFSNPDGGAEKEYFGKCHIKNINATYDLLDSVIWIDNILTDPSATGTLKITTTGVGDNDTKYCRIIGEDNGGTPTFENVILPATPGDVYSTTQWLLNRRLVVELRSVADNSLTLSSSDIYIIRGTVLGKIPEGRYDASGRIDIGVEATLNDSTTTINRLTAPSGITFYRANESNALSVANSGVLTAGAYQSVWVRLTLHDGALPVNYSYPDLSVDGITE